MLSAGWVIGAVVLAVLLTTWITFTITRLDRLHARVDAAQAALDAQLVRRSAAVLYLAELPGTGLAPLHAIELIEVAHRALGVDTTERQDAENAVGRAVSSLDGYRGQLPDAAVSELIEASARVGIARRFYNDAVRDTRTIRSRRVPRLLHLAGRRTLPLYFDIDDTTLFGADTLS